MDGHSSHYCSETIRMAAEEKIILFTLPPNTYVLLRNCYFMYSYKLGYLLFCNQ